MSKDLIPSDELSEFLLYTSPSGEVKVEIHVQNDTVWLTQQKMTLLFGTTKQNVSYHLNNIFKDNGLDKDSVVKDFLTAPAATMIKERKNILISP